MGFKTSVSIVIYKRPSETRALIDSLREIAPEKLFVIGDGPKGKDVQESLLVASARKVIESVDWPCDVRTLYSETNMGSKERVVSGLDWVFSQVEDSVILEDDCIPDISFFRFCEEMIGLYKNDLRIGGIGGTNVLHDSFSESESSYFFSRYPAIWGWATWRRVWALYSPTVPSQDRLRSVMSGNFAPSKENQRFWYNKLESVRRLKVDAWDYQLALTCAEHDLLWIIPRTNLISNIGFGVDATHTLDVKSPFNSMEITPLPFPLKHESKTLPNETFDRELRGKLHKESFGRGFALRIYFSLPQKIRGLLKSIFLKLGGSNE